MAPARRAGRAGPRGQRRVVAVLAGLAVAALVAGCATARSRDEFATPEQLAERRALSRAAQEALDRRDWPAAQDALLRLIATSPRSAEAHQRLGQVYEAQGQAAPAEAAYRAALAIDADYPAALVGLGRVETQAGRLQAALEHLDQAIDLDPRRAEAHRARAVTLEALGRTDVALAAYFRALEFEPDDAAAAVRIAALQIDRNAADQALVRLGRVLERVPDDPGARHQRGRALLALGRPGPALDDLRAASQALPGRADVLYDLARALAASGPTHRADALDAAQRAATLAPGWPAPRELGERLRR